MELTEIVKTGEILRKPDGLYCFSCNLCGKYFDAIHEIIDHMNKTLSESSQKSDKLGDTEFVDVSTTLEVNYEPGEEDSSDEHLGIDLGDMSISTIENQIYLLKCCWCTEIFSDFGLIINHFTDDHNKKPSDIHSCEECRIFFKNMKLLGEHTLLLHGQVAYEQLQKAYQIESSKPIQCAVCNKWTYGSKSFDSHTKRVHKMYRILQCYICRIFKKKPSGLIDHLKVHDRFRKYRCYECDNVEPKITNPYDSRPHKCVLCNIWFFNHVTIRNHITNVHQQDQIYDCSICDIYTFKTELDLKMHNTDVHIIPMEYKCKYCSKRCKSLPSLKEHQKSHLAKGNLNLCTICGSKFRRKDYLSRHIKSHGEASKDFTCYICKKQFQSNGYLKNHIKRHTEKKMHICDVCGNRFLLAGLLRKHMREHEGELWKCDQCCKEFSNKSKLTAHEKTHVTERNFRCDVSYPFG